MPSKVWDELTYPFPNFNGCIQNLIWLFNLLIYQLTELLIFIYYVHIALNILYYITGSSTILYIHSVVELKDYDNNQMQKK